MKLKIVKMNLSKHVNVPILATENNIPLPGQCAVSISEADKWNVRKVTVIFEIEGDIPTDCPLSVNFK